MFISLDAQRASDRWDRGRAGDSVDRATWNRSTRTAWRPSLTPQCGSGSWFQTCYDEGQTRLYCPFCGGQQMHSCPSAYAMTGAGMGNNLFQCTYVGPYMTAYFETGGTQRNLSIACQPGYFVAGMHEVSNVLYCASTGRITYSEQVVGVGPMTSCGAVAYGLGVVTGWNRMREFMMCAGIR